MPVAVALQVAAPSGWLQAGSQAGMLKSRLPSTLLSTSGPHSAVPARLHRNSPAGSTPAIAYGARLVAATAVSTSGGGGDVYDDGGPGSLGWAPFDNERYVFKHVIGKGGWGTVHLAEDTVEGGREVAIKVQSKWPRQEAGKRMPSAAAVLAHLRNEGDCLAAMQRSPRVVQLLARAEDKDNAYLVTEYLRGGDLEAVFEERSRLSERAAAELVRGVLLVLRDCHSCGLCFSDVKPANFMLHVEADGRQTVKAVDFGCAQEYTPGSTLSKRVGTPVFFAPEMFERCYGQEADVWSVGIMMYRFLSGRFPWFEGAPGRVPPGQIMAAVLSDPIALDGPTWSYKSDTAKDLLRRLLQRDPTKRLRIADALRHPWLRHHCGDDEDEPCAVGAEAEEAAPEEAQLVAAGKPPPEEIPRDVVMSNVVSLYSKQTERRAAKTADAERAASGRAHAG